MSRPLYTLHWGSGKIINAYLTEACACAMAERIALKEARLLLMYPAIVHIRRDGKLLKVIARHYVDDFAFRDKAASRRNRRESA